MHNWYPENWLEIAKAIKDRAGWNCEKCHRHHNPKAGYMLGVHHKDGDKGNSKRTNLVALCQRCHLRAEARLIRYGTDQDQLFLQEVLK